MQIKLRYTKNDFLTSGDAKGPRRVSFTRSTPDTTRTGRPIHVLEVFVTNMVWIKSQGLEQGEMEM